MATSLENQYIDESYQKLVQIEGTALSDGTGSAVTELNITAANATAAVSASHAIKADSATSASYAASTTLPGGIVSSSAQISYTGITDIPNAIVSSSTQVESFGFVKAGITGSLVETASSALNVLTFTKGDGTTFNVTVDTGSASVEDWDSLVGKPNGLVSGSTQISDLGFVQSDITGSSVITGSVNQSNLTFTKGDGTTFDLLVTAPPSISASYAETATSASWAQRAYFAETVEWTGINNKPTVVSGSSQITLVDTIGDLPATRITGVITSASHALKADTADSATSADSVAYANITGKPTLVSGSSQITLADATGNLDGARITGTVSNATNAVSASIANTATTAVLATSAVSATSASHAVNADIVGLFNKDILDGTAYQVLRTDGAGNLSFDYADRTNIEVRTIEAVTKGDPLRVVGFNNGQNRIEVRRADASNSAFMPAYGVAYETIGANQNTQMVALGALDDVNTQVAPNDFQEGDVLYVKSGGGLTNVKPTGTNLIQNVGKVARRNQNNGEILVSAIGRSNDVPNIAEGNIWVGNSNGVATPTSTGSFAKTDKNNVFTGTQTFDNISVNGTGSFAYIQSVTGSAKVIGDAFLILNNDTPAERYAGIKVIDSGSATATTASLQFDGQTNDWFYEYESDATDFGVVMFGPEYATKGSPTYNTANTILKADGGHHLLDSIITDDGSTVTVGGDITANVIQANTYLVGDVIGNASTATSASFATQANNAISSDTSTLAANSSQLNGQAASFYLDASNINAGTIADAYLPATISSDITGNAATATSASYAPFITGSITDADVTWTNRQSFTSRVRGDLNGMSTSGTSNVDLSLGNFFSVIVSGPITINPTNIASSGWGQTISVLIDNTASQTVDFTNIKFPGGTAPTITAGGIDILTIVTINGVAYGTVVQNLN